MSDVLIESPASQLLSDPRVVALDGDERRLLTVLDRCGPQPALVSGNAPGALTVIGREAGCADPSGVPGRLQRLSGLGLIRVSRRPLADRRYAVLAATRPDGADLRRCSIDLTRWGRTVLAQAG